MKTCRHCRHQWYLRKGSHGKRHACPSCGNRLARLPKISGSRLRAEFKDGLSVVGLARKHAMPAVVVARRLRASKKSA